MVGVPLNSLVFSFPCAVPFSIQLPVKRKFLNLHWPGNYCSKASKFLVHLKLGVWLWLAQRHKWFRTDCKILSAQTVREYDWLPSFFPSVGSRMGEGGNKGQSGTEFFLPFKWVPCELMWIYISMAANGNVLISCLWSNGREWREIRKKSSDEKQRKKQNFAVQGSDADCSRWKIKGKGKAPD